MAMQPNMLTGYEAQSFTAQNTNHAATSTFQGKTSIWERMKNLNPFHSKAQLQQRADNAPTQPVPFPQSPRSHVPQPRPSYEEFAPSPRPGSFTQTQYLSAPSPPPDSAYYATQQQLYEQHLQNQLLSAQLTGQMTLPAPVLVSMLSEAQRSNELLRKESQQRTQGMRDIVDAVNRHLGATDRMMQLAAREQGVDLFKGKGAPPPASDQLPRWKQQLVPYSPDAPSPHQLQPQGPGLKAEMKMQVTEDPGVNRSPGFRHAPESAHTLISHHSSKPSAKWDPLTSDVRIASWHLEGLSFSVASGDFEAISIVSSLIHHCRPDVLVLTGLAGNGSAAAKITALLNLWGEEGKEGGTWRHIICPGSQSSVAMLWLESRLVRTWGDDGFNHAHGLVSGLFSLHSRPVLVVTTSEREPRDISSAVDLLAAGLVKSHHGLVDSMHVAILPPFQHDPSRQLDDQYEALMENESHHNHHRHDNIFISKAPHGAKTITRDARVVQPISSEGRVGVSARPPFATGAVHLNERQAQRVMGRVQPTGLHWCDLRVKEKSHEPPPSSYSSSHRQEPPPSSSSYSSTHRSSLILDDSDDLKFKPSTYLEAAKTTSSKPSTSSSIGLGGSRSTVGLTKPSATGLSTSKGGLASRW
jgi:hypothetical protein